MENNEKVILVNENDQPVGQCSKLEAHEKALLHRAFSVIILNSKGEILLQQRTWNKYHSPGLWSNTCCSHPYPGESVEDAANRRLMEEMGIKTPLKFLFKFQYKTEFDNGLAENEIDYVFLGLTNKLPVINKQEVDDYKFVEPGNLKIDIHSNPKLYTSWFRIIFQKLTEYTDIVLF